MKVHSEKYLVNFPDKTQTDGRPGKDKNGHILPTGQRYAPSAVNYSAYSA